MKNHEGVIDVNLSLPTGLGGEGVLPGTTTPEDLFAAGYAACFGGALGAVAPGLKITPETSGVLADVVIGRNTEKGLGLGVKLTGKRESFYYYRVRLTFCTGFFTGITEAEGQKLMETAHSVCPYSNATRNNIEVKKKKKTMKNEVV
jgi:Ohr subfamily peroxiredoxin